MPIPQHRKYWDSFPQLSILPLLPLGKVKEWEEDVGCDTLVLAVSAEAKKEASNVASASTSAPLTTVDERKEEEELTNEPQAIEKKQKKRIESKKKISVDESEDLNNPKSVTVSSEDQCGDLLSEVTAEKKETTPLSSTAPMPSAPES